MSLSLFNNVPVGSIEMILDKENHPFIAVRPCKMLTQQAFVCQFYYKESAEGICVRFFKKSLK